MILIAMPRVLCSRDPDDDGLQQSGLDGGACAQRDLLGFIHDEHVMSYLPALS